VPNRRRLLLGSFRQMQYKNMSENDAPRIGTAYEPELGQHLQEKTIVVTKVDDKALEFLTQHGGASRPVSHEENKWLLRKIDTLLLSLVIRTRQETFMHRIILTNTGGCYLMMQFLDKNALSSSVNFGIRKDTHLVAINTTGQADRSFIIPTSSLSHLLLVFCRTSQLAASLLFVLSLCVNITLS
jgi:hypothetical protein